MTRLQGQGIAPLLNKFDIDPGDWRPLYYPVEIEVGVAAGAIGRNSVSVNNMPYIWVRTTHGIKGDVADPETSNLWNDGQYDVNFRDEESVYQRDWAPANLVFGGYGPAQGGQQGGYLIDMPYPIAFSGNRTVTFEVRNSILRAPTDQSTTFKVVFVMHGISSWGKARSRVS